MNKIFMILGMIVMAFVVTFMYSNRGIILDLSYHNFSFTLDFFKTSLIIFVLGSIAGTLMLLDTVYAGLRRVSSTKRMLEKQSVSVDDYELQIRALENKIQTLETALDKALKK